MGAANGLRLGACMGPLLPRPDMIVMRRTHFQEGEQEAQAGFRALIFVDSIRMQSVTATARHGVVEHAFQLILTDEPVEGPPGPLGPDRVASTVLGLEARRNHPTGLDGLLVEYRLQASPNVESV